MLDLTTEMRGINSKRFISCPSVARCHNRRSAIAENAQSPETGRVSGSVPNSGPDSDLDSDLYLDLGLNPDLNADPDCDPDSNPDITGAPIFGIAH